MMGRSLHWMVVLAFVGCFLGCSKDGGRGGTVPAAGVVKLNGSPVAEALVTFAPKSGVGSAATASTDASGRFSLSTSGAGDGAVPGEYNVAIVKQVVDGKVLTDEELQKYMDEHPGMAPPEIKTKSLIPEQYGVAATSGLTATVTESGPNEFTFDLK